MSQEIQTYNTSTSAMIFNGDMLDKMQSLANLMATSKVTVPAHFRGQPGDCLAVVMQAMQWQMNPYAVAQKTFLVSGVLGYEAQLVNAVIQNSGAIKGRFHYEYKGEGQNISCRVGAVISGEGEITWGEWLSAASVTTKNSPLWKTNPQQQLGYLQVKNWGRAFCPGAILGVYTPDELEPVVAEKELNPITETDGKTSAILDKLHKKPPIEHGPVTGQSDSGAGLPEAMAAIAKAHDRDTLDTAKALMMALSGGNKAIADQAYRERVAELKKQYEQKNQDPYRLGAVLDAIAKAKSKAALDAVDRSGLDDGQAKTAETAWLKKQAELEAKPVDWAQAVNECGDKNTLIALLDEMPESAQMEHRDLIDEQLDSLRD